jgi:putative salt-induced outer membrane protein YdiY
LVRLKPALRVALILLAGAAFSAGADEIVLRNGDRIRGQIASLSDGKLVVRTDYAGEIGIRWNEVASLSTTRPVGVMRKTSSAPLHGTLQPLYDGRILVVGQDGAAVELTLDEIAYLNPQPWESGIGVAYSGRVTLSAAYTRGNTEDERLNGDGEFTARAREYRYAFSALVDHRDEPATGTNTAWRAGANYDRFLQADRFVYARGSLEHDRAKDVDRRSAAGFGYGAELLDTARASLSVRGGLDYVTVERFIAPDESYPALGWGVKASYAPFFHEHEGFWNLEDTRALLVRSKTGVRAPLWQGISASLLLQLDWEREPAPGRKSTDSTLLLGLDYAW